MRLNPDLDADALAATFRKDRRAQAVGLLVEEDARALYEDVVAQTSWSLSLFAQGKNVDVDAAGWSKLAPDARERTRAIVHEEANHGFAYFNRRISIYDRWHAGRRGLSAPLASLFEFLNGADFLDFARRMTGAGDIAFADAQLTAFDPGHFLTVHNDDVEGKNRRCAYVLNLTPRWMEDWGGYLCFFDATGNLVGGYKPAFNTLNVFAIPARHSVSVVAPFAREPRYGVSGWLRAGSDPARDRQSAS